jgi:8-oxo-dGTP pyrophosphatase MutT (NUDIX family)
MVRMMEGAGEGDPARAAAERATDVVPARAAATVILLRGGRESLELLLVRRTPHARFMGGVWVFPGGAVDRQDALSDGDGDGAVDGGRDPEGGCGASDGRAEADALRRAAMRELHEEAGIELPGSEELIEFSRWITPRVVPTRYDTHFFLARLPAGQEPQVDGEECIEHRWFTPPAALDAHREQEIELVFPTIKHLEQLSRFDSVDALIEHARGRAVLPVEPRVVMEGEVARVLLPGDPGY